MAMQLYQPEESDLSIDEKNDAIAIPSSTTSRQNPPFSLTEEFQEELRDLLGSENLGEAEQIRLEEFLKYQGLDSKTRNQINSALKKSKKDQKDATIEGGKLDSSYDDAYKKTHPYSVITADGKTHWLNKEQYQLYQKFPKVKGERYSALDLADLNNKLVKALQAQGITQRQDIEKFLVRSTGLKAAATGFKKFSGWTSKAIPEAAKQRKPLSVPKEESLIIDLDEVERIGTLQDLDDPVADFLGVGVFEPGISTQGAFDSLLGGGMGTDRSSNVFNPEVDVEQELNISVSGDMRIVASIKDARGNKGFMFLWKGEVIPWFPPEKKDSLMGLFDI